MGTDLLRFEVAHPKVALNYTFRKKIVNRSLLSKSRLFRIYHFTVYSFYYLRIKGEIQGCPKSSQAGSLVIGLSKAQSIDPKTSTLSVVFELFGLN